MSPILSNVMLDDLDRELWARGHRFVRYADDVRVFVRSKRAAQRVLDSVTEVVGQRLKLKVNREKSSVQPASKATLLGFGFYFARSGVRIRVDPKVITRLKDRVRVLTSRRWGVSMPCRIDALNKFIGGWAAYFQLADLSHKLRELDSDPRLDEPPDAGPHVRWGGRSAGRPGPPTRFSTVTGGQPAADAATPPAKSGSTPSWASMTLTPT